MPLTMRAWVVWCRYVIGHRSVRYGVQMLPLEAMSSTYGFCCSVGRGLAPAVPRDFEFAEMGEKRNMVLRGGGKPPPYAAQFQTLKAKVDDIAPRGRWLAVRRDG